MPLFESGLAERSLSKTLGRIGRSIVPGPTLVGWAVIARMRSFGKTQGERAMVGFVWQFSTSSASTLASFWLFKFFKEKRDATTPIGFVFLD